MSSNLSAIQLPKSELVFSILQIFSDEHNNAHVLFIPYIKSQIFTSTATLSPAKQDLHTFSVSLALNHNLLRVPQHYLLQNKFRGKQQLHENVHCIQVQLAKH